MRNPAVQSGQAVALTGLTVREVEIARLRYERTAKQIHCRSTAAV